jgi:hypothetical protein
MSYSHHLKPYKALALWEPMGLASSSPEISLIKTRIITENVYFPEIILIDRKTRKQFRQGFSVGFNDFMAAWIPGSR